MDLEHLRVALSELRDRIVAREQAGAEHGEFKPLVELADECSLLAAGAGAGIGDGRPLAWLRAFALVATIVAGAVAVALSVTVLVFAVRTFTGGSTSAENLPALQAGVGLIVILAGAVLSLWAHERRGRRRGLFATLLQVRTLAHRVDLQQLAKPTENYLIEGPATDASPVQQMSDFEFSRFLIYSRALLSWLGKIAALHATNVTDPVVLSAVDDVEALTTRLQQGIGQRLLLLRSIVAERDPS